MPQFMLEVTAIARPRIPPGKISLSTNQGTGRKGKVDGEQQSGGKSTDADSQITDLCPTDLCKICACRAVSFHIRRRDVLSPLSSQVRDRGTLTRVPGRRGAT